QVGLKEVIAAARDLGITDALPAVPSLALGAAEVNLLELTAAYAAVQVGKMPIKPWGVGGFGVGQQTHLQSMGPPIGGTQSLQPYQKPLLELMQDVVRHGTGRAAALDGFAAGKTGTSQKYRDAWFIGFNDTLITGVWVGNDDRAPMKRVTGGSLPAAIWKPFMEQAGPAATAASTPASSQASETVGLAPGPSEASDQADAGRQVNMALPDMTECNARVCERFYHSFRTSDFTYQPYWGGSRRVCDRQ